MNILTLTRYNPFTTYDGASIFVKNLSFKLIKLGHEIHVVCGLPSSAQQSASNISASNICGNLYEIPHVSTWLVGGLQFNIQLGKILFKLMNAYKFDVVACHGAGQAFAFSRVKKDEKDGPLLVYYALDCMASEYVARKILPLNRRLKDFVYYRMLVIGEKSACSRADLIIANSYSTEKVIKENYGVPQEKIETIYLAIPDDFANGYKTIDPKTPTFLHIATSHERKGTIYLLESIKVLREKYQINANALIVGKKDPYSIDTSKRMGINANFVGNVPEAMLKQLYASCTCLVVPSLREGFCLPVIEAAMFGKSTIATNAGSLPELVQNGKTGFVVSIGDVNALARKMYLVSVDNDLRRKMGGNAKERAQRFKISNIARKTLNIYSNGVSAHLTL